MDTVEYLKQQWTFSTNDDNILNSNCPITKIHTYFTPAAFEAGTVPLSSGNFDSIDFNMDDSKKGRNEIFFSIGGIPTAASNYGTGIITICGKETLT